MANYLTFASPEPFTLAVNNATKNWDGTLCYSTDSATWNEWDGAAAIASSEHGGEQRIYMRGSGNTVITGGTENANWVLTGSDIHCTGNIENLLDYETVANGEHPLMANECYRYLFKNCISLITPPGLPATTLSYGCYGAMFRNCTSLITVPALPATKLARACYSSMFYGCTNLTTLPGLPATWIADDSYCFMFYGCTNIKMSRMKKDGFTTEYRIPISGTALEVNATAFMFEGTGGELSNMYNGGDPALNTTYYTANEVIPPVVPEEPSVPFEPDPFSVTLGWLVGSRIAGQVRQSQNKPQFPDGVLISSDGYMLKDSNGLYLIGKDDS